MKAIGIAFILLALAIGILPQFTNCEARGHSIELPGGRTIPMKCYWSAKAELAAAAPLLLTGLLIVSSSSGAARRALAGVGALLGIFVILIPTILIGVCAGDEMLCQILMKPALILSGIFVLAAGLGGAVFGGSEQSSNHTVAKSSG